MSRPRYCKPENRENERRVIGIFVDFLRATGPTLKWGYAQTAKDCDVDGVIYRNSQPVAVVEVKGRKGDCRRYTEWHVSNDKVERAKAHAKKLGLPFILLFSWDQSVFFIDSSKIPADAVVAEGGRWDREDPFDVEDMLYIPARLFTRVPENIINVTSHEHNN